MLLIVFRRSIKITAFRSSGCLAFVGFCTSLFSWTGSNVDRLRNECRGQPSPHIGCTSHELEARHQLCRKQPQKGSRDLPVALGAIRPRPVTEQPVARSYTVQAVLEGFAASDLPKVDYFLSFWPSGRMFCRFQSSNLWGASAVALHKSRSTSARYIVTLQVTGTLMS